MMVLENAHTRDFSGLCTILRITGSDVRTPRAHFRICLSRFSATPSYPRTLRLPIVNLHSDEERRRASAHGRFAKRLFGSKAVGKQRPRTLRSGARAHGIFRAPVLQLCSQRPPCLLSVLSASSPPRLLARSLLARRPALSPALRWPPVLRQSRPRGRFPCRRVGSARVHVRVQFLLAVEEGDTDWLSSLVQLTLHSRRGSRRS